MRDTNGVARRRALAPGTGAGITEEMIGALVHAFYGKVRRDSVLGPIFAHVVEDWDPHLRRMVDFWSSVLLMSGRYKGNPVAKHYPLELEGDHFERWLSLFIQTASEVCRPEAAAVFTAKAEMIAQSLELASAVQRGGLTPRSQAGRPDDSR